MYNFSNTCEICSKLRIKTAEQLSAALTLDIFHAFFTFSAVNFEQVNLCRDPPYQLINAEKTY